MAKCKRSKGRPQPKHKKSKKSQHDKRTRLDRSNPHRRKTTKAKVPLTGVMQDRRAKVTRQYKTFPATSPLVSGVIRVVIVRFEDGGWIPYFCKDPTAEVRDILEAAAARWAIEEHFHDVKEIWGAGQQQVRNVWSTFTPYGTPTARCFPSPGLPPERHKPPCGIRQST